MGRKAGPVNRLSALRVASAFRTISEEAVCVISGVLPLRVLAKEKQTLYQRKRSSILSTEELREEERQNSICRWQLQWDAGKKGRWTHRLIPQIDVCLNRNHGEVNYYLIQMLSGHGCFRAYLHRFKRDDSLKCPSCPGKPEDAEHVFSCSPF
ncbi:Putative 115 kDa protein in type-1 retrotransposable element R1DM [Eumeta japonica]|uniref:115 kDa protein in type-1 retrotransposable element R1DM n=1 Tax=Eumeta variegata TaxID=151549 RepID=A0A4C1U533_EUMVA|nr:Putative 115 kDa protein in type-1 retrotransposable element R1DM [Eumeta japonica]